MPAEVLSYAVLSWHNCVSVYLLTALARKVKLVMSFCPSICFHSVLNQLRSIFARVMTIAWRRLKFKIIGQELELARMVMRSVLAQSLIDGSLSSVSMLFCHSVIAILIIFRVYLTLCTGLSVEGLLWAGLWWQQQSDQSRCCQSCHTGQCSTAWQYS